MAGSGSCKVQVSCQINPSEDPSKVKTAVLNIFPDLEISISDKLLIGKSNGMNTLSNISESIRSIIRFVLIENYSKRFHIHILQQKLSHHMVS